MSDPFELELQSDTVPAGHQIQIPFKSNEHSQPQSHFSNLVLGIFDLNSYVYNFLKIHVKTGINCMLSIALDISVFILEI